LSTILGPEYDVRASVGHIRDLPKSRLGVDIERGFEPRYLVPPEKRDVVRQLREAAGRADVVYLATDPDREGEAISWHLAEAADLKPGRYRRVVFHEITPQAVKEAFRHPRDIDLRLVDAQQARRILDRLVGYKISPLLWQKIRRGLSAGRVQSVALRMIVEREREIQAFQPQEYWTIDVALAKPGTPDAFTARLYGRASAKKLEIGSAEQAAALAAELRDATVHVRDVKTRQVRRRPQPPFTTSTLQQEASRRFGFTAKRTMALAQQLYEGVDVAGNGRVGLITYMRTDSLHVAESARRETREYIAGRWGEAYLPSSPRVYKTKTKGAQEAHEAIRPTSIERTPESVRRWLSADQLKLYTLIWQRMVACQMADAVYDQTTVEVEAAPRANPRDPLYLRATCSVLAFPGYRAVYQETKEDGSAEDDETRLPPLAAGDPLEVRDVTPEQHFTEPPPRYTEATLVKALEENGIGRPSTYAPIISTIIERGYVAREGRALKPLDLGFVVNDLLVQQFPSIVDVGFTAEMEEDLDQIARGERPWQPVVEEFYRPLEEALERASKAPKVVEETGEVCEKCGRPMVLRWGRFGRFLACTGFPECRNTRPVEGEEREALPETTETCPECGAPMAVRRGRFGMFLACTRYPECKGRKRIENKVGVTCPRCGQGEIVQRQTRRGRRRTFYGCSRYPECDFTSWSKPLAEACPKCGARTLVAAARGKARCTSCEWQGAVAAERELAEAPA
ncbi:MAG TPA: type I DNA topoisomerase, partial [Dehalococcoidia bacterium]|nr:type I DNA topoisomerase [Dehalococcoidia bacterium]